MKCEKCGEYLEANDDNFNCIESGKGFHPDFGEYYWWSGEITCTCGNIQGYEDQSI